MADSLEEGPADLGEVPLCEDEDADFLGNQPKPVASNEKTPAAASSAAAAPTAPAAAPVPDNAPKAADIFLLARQQNFDVAQKLLDAYPHLWHARDDDGHTLLHWAALVGNNNFAKLAMERDNPVDAQALNLQTPLMWAVLRGHTTTARILLEQRADMRIKDSLGATAMMIAIQHAQYQPMLLMMHRGNRDALLADADKNGCTSAHWAAYKGDLTALKLLAYFGSNLLQLDNAGMMPLHRATFGSQQGVVEFLMEQKADPTMRNGDGKNCLDIAETQGDIAMQTLYKKLLRKSDSAASNDVEMNNMGATDARAKDDEKEKKQPFFRQLQTTFKDKSMHKIFPAFWLVCVSLGMFQYLIDFQATSFAVAPYASLFFTLGIPLSLAIFAYTALMDPGKVPAKTPGNSGVEEIMRALDSPDEHVVDMSRLCTTTWVLKGLRSKYCKETGAVVEEFDHYCIWLNCAIGRNNHRPFICLAIVECLTQLSHLYLLWTMARELVPAPGVGSWILGCLTGYPLLTLMFILHAFTAPWVFMLFLHQSRLVAMNLTTNEMMNAGRYEHFWINTQNSGRLQRLYRNPFSKGSVLKNFLDFWWVRDRASFGPMESLNAEATKKLGCCANQPGHGNSRGHGHGHSHG